MHKELCCCCWYINHPSREARGVPACATRLSRVNLSDSCCCCLSVSYLWLIEVDYIRPSFGAFLSTTFIRTFFCRSILIFRPCRKKGLQLVLFSDFLYPFLWKGIWHSSPGFHHNCFTRVFICLNTSVCFNRSFKLLSHSFTLTQHQFTYR